MGGFFLGGGGDQQTIDNSVKSKLWMIRFVHILMFYLKWSRFFCITSTGVLRKTNRDQELGDAVPNTS